MAQHMLEDPVASKERKEKKKKMVDTREGYGRIGEEIDGEEVGRYE